MGAALMAVMHGFKLGETEQVITDRMVSMTLGGTFRHFGIVLFAVILEIVASNALAATRAGSVTFLTGEVSITHAGGAAQPAAQGVELLAGDTITTGADGELQAELEDGGMIAVRSNSVFRIDDYKAEGEETDSSIFSLLKGAARSVTGFIGKISPANYQINTPTATIGVRGTDHEIVVIPEGQAGADEIVGTHDRVYEGETFIQAGGNSIDIKEGQAGFYNATLSGRPKLHDRIPAFIERRRSRHDDRVENYRRNVIERIENKLRQRGKLQNGETLRDYIQHRREQGPGASNTRPERFKAKIRREMRRRRHLDN
ncbi:MAG: FecR family protein [Gammaproteobacteria bacterium]